MGSFWLDLYRGMKDGRNGFTGNDKPGISNRAARGARRAERQRTVLSCKLSVGVYDIYMIIIMM